MKPNPRQRDTSHDAGTSESTMDGAESPLYDELVLLWEEAESIWEENEETPPFAAYVGADFGEIYLHLVQMRKRALTFLEWGSGLGVVAIMADRLGFEAYGIEAVPELVEHSRRLAERFGSSVQFAQGSFIPDEFEWNPSSGDQVVETFIDIPGAYSDLDRELCDFDLIYGYPWPDEHGLFHNIIRELGRPGAFLLSYDAREGAELVHFDQ